MICSGQQLSALIDEYVNGYNAERNRAILKTRYLCGKSFQDTAEIHDVSVSTVSRVVHKYGEPIMILLSSTNDLQSTCKRGQSELQVTGS